MSGVPRTIPGPNHPNNRFAVDWSANGFLAYGCLSNIVLIDPFTGQVAQMLVGGHKSVVTRCKIRKQPPSLNPRVQLASGDDSGMIILWNVITGKAEMTVTGSTTKGSNKIFQKPVVDLAWISDVTGDFFLLALHATSQLSLWNTEQGEMIWHITASSDEVMSFALDPFLPSRICLVTEGMLVVVNDFSTTTAPTNLNTKYNVSGPAQEKPKSKFKDSDSEVSLKVHFSPLDRDVLFLLLAREVLIMDLTTNQTIGRFVLERSGSPFQDMYPCESKHLIYCLHQNGCISARLRKQEIGSAYSFVGQSEALRLNKGSRVQSMAIGSLHDSAPCLITTDGRILFYKFLSPEFVEEQARTQEIINPIHDNSFFLHRVVQSIAASIVSLKMCPERVQTRTQCGSWVNTSLAAIGTTTGFVQLCDLSTSAMKRQYYITLSPIRGVDWATNSIVCYSSEENSTSIPSWRNLVVDIDLRSGSQRKILEVSDQGAAIVGVKVSELGQYVVILYQEKPFELWDLRNATLLKVMPTTFPRIAGLVWSISGLRKKSLKLEDSLAGGKGKAKTTLQREHLVVTTFEGHILHFTVEGSVVRYGARIPTDPIMGAVTCLAWKEDWIVTGDSAGALHIWDLKAKLSSSVTTNHGAVKEIMFFTEAGATKFLALFADGVDVWDAATSDVVARKSEDMKFPSKINTAVAIGWSPTGNPVVAYSEGVVKVFDAWLTTSSSSIESNTYDKPIQILAANSPKVVQYAKSVMQYETFDAATLACEDEDGTKSESETRKHDTMPYVIEATAITMLKQNLPKTYFKSLTEATLVSDRCLLTATIFGDMYEYKFWWLFKHYRKLYRKELDISLASPQKMKDLRSFRQPQPTNENVGPISTPYEPEDMSEEHLPSHFDILGDASEIRGHKLHRLKMRSGRKDAEAEEKNRCTQQHVLLGQNSTAVQMLLETDAKENNFYENSLRACIVSAVSSPSTCQNTIKLVAMNLIAAGKLDAGVELLCLVGCNLDACHYLQSEGQWRRAAHLAKATLHPVAYREVFSRWIEHLQGSKKKAEAVMLCLSICQWKRALSLLNSMNSPNLTVLFAEACLEENLLELEHDLTVVDKPQSNKIAATGPLLQSVWAKADTVATTARNRRLIQRYKQKITESQI